MDFVRRVRHAGYLVIHHGRVDHAAVVPQHLFGQGVTQHLYDTTLYLAFHRGFIDCLAHVVGGPVFEYFHLSRYLVHFHLRNLRPEGEDADTVGHQGKPPEQHALGVHAVLRRVEPVMGTHDRAPFLPQRPAGNRGKRQHRVRHAFHADDTALPELKVRCVALQYLPGMTVNLLPDIVAGFFYRVADGVGVAACRRLELVGG